MMSPPSASRLISPTASTVKSAVASTSAMMGVTSVGVLANTREPVPVSSVTAANICADVATNVLLVKLMVLLVSVCDTSVPTIVVVASGMVMVLSAVGSTTVSNVSKASAVAPSKYKPLVTMAASNVLLVSVCAPSNVVSTRVAEPV